MPDPSLVIRPAVHGDADDVWPLVRDFAPPFRPEREAFDRSFRSLLAAPETLLLVAEQSASEIVGYLVANIHVTLLSNGPVAWIEEVMVDERARRKGVGQALMTAAESWARSHGAAYVSLASRRAGAFYVALAYEDSATYFKKPLKP